MAEIARVGWEIANDQLASGRDRAAALKKAREAHNNMFQMLFDAGAFERRIGVGKRVSDMFSGRLIRHQTGRAV